MPLIEETESVFNNFIIRPRKFQYHDFLRQFNFVSQSNWMSGSLYINQQVLSRSPHSLTSRLTKPSNHPSFPRIDARPEPFNCGLIEQRFYCEISYVLRSVKPFVASSLLRRLHFTISPPLVVIFWLWVLNNKLCAIVVSVSVFPFP